MGMVLQEKLWSYIGFQNPELMYELQDKYSVSEYLDEKISGDARAGTRN